MDRQPRRRTSPVAVPAAVLHGDRWRVTVPTTGLLRVEWAEDGALEDRACTLALHRDLPVPAFHVVDGEEVLGVLPERVHLTRDRRRPSPSPSGPLVQVLGGVSSWCSTWRHGDPDHSPGGTARTLDVVAGRTPLGPGVVGRGGVAVPDEAFCSRDDRCSPDEHLALLDRFEAEGVRFSVAVIDMDWHRVDSVPPAQVSD